MLLITHAFPPLSGALDLLTFVPGASQVKSVVQTYQSAQATETAASGQTEVSPEAKAMQTAVVLGASAIPGVGPVAGAATAAYFDWANSRPCRSIGGAAGSCTDPCPGCFTCPDPKEPRCELATALDPARVTNEGEDVVYVIGNVGSYYRESLAQVALLMGDYPLEQLFEDQSDEFKAAHPYVPRQQFSPDSWHLPLPAGERVRITGMIHNRISLAPVQNRLRLSNVALADRLSDVLSKVRAPSTSMLARPVNARVIGRITGKTSTVKPRLPAPRPLTKTALSSKAKWAMGAAAAGLLLGGLWYATRREQ